MGKVFKATAIILTTLLILFVIRLAIFGSQSKKMQSITTLKNQRLGLCSDKPNCVSSFQNTDDSHYIQPLNTRETLLLKLEDYLKQEGCSRVKIVENYWSYVCKSSLFGFVDDLELLYKPQEGMLHYRSASRVGYSDLGANRKRIEKLIYFIQN